MVAIYLTEEWTQVVRASVRHGAFNIISGDYLDPYLQDFVRSDAGQLVEMFREVQAITKTKDDEIHIVLPDYVFRLIGCYVVPVKKGDTISYAEYTQYRAWLRIFLKPVEYYNREYITNPWRYRSPSVGVIDNCYFMKLKR